MSDDKSRNKFMQLEDGTPIEFEDLARKEAQERREEKFIPPSTGPDLGKVFTPDVVMRAAFGTKATALPEQRVLTSITADKIAPKLIRWLWPNRFAQKLNLIVGNPDECKSMVSIDVVARLTTGHQWFDGMNTMPVSEAVILAAEDDWDDTIVPRLKASGADLTKVHKLNMTVDKNGTKREREISLTHDFTALEQFLTEHGNIRLIVIDPISSYLGDKKMIDEQSVRELLLPFKDLANRLRVAIICIMHLNKKVDLDAIHRIGGAMAFVGVARMVWLCATMKDDEGKNTDESVMVKIKGNIVQKTLKGLSFTVKVQQQIIEGEETFIPYVEWREVIDKTPDELLIKQKSNPAHRPAQQLPSAVAFVNEFLKDGPKPLDDLEADGQALYAFSKRTMARARAQANVITFPSGKREGRDGKQRDRYSCRLPFEGGPNGSKPTS